MLPRHLGRAAEALERVFEVFSARTAPRPKAKNTLPFFASKATGYTLFCIIPFWISKVYDQSNNRDEA